VAGAEVVDDVRVPAAEALADRATSGRLLPDALPPEAEKAMDEFARDYERRWLDMEIPALAGLTPRQAADDPTRREDLVALLAEFDQFPPGPGAMDNGRLRAMLGLDR